MSALIAGWFLVVAAAAGLLFVGTRIDVTLGQAGLILFVVGVPIVSGLIGWKTTREQEEE